MKGRKRGKERYTLYIYTRANKEEQKGKTGREAGTNTINKDTTKVAHGFKWKKKSRHFCFLGVV